MASKQMKECIFAYRNRDCWGNYSCQVCGDYYCESGECAFFKSSKEWEHYVDENGNKFVRKKVKSGKRKAI